MSTRDTNVQLMLDWLTQEGYRPRLDHDGDLLFKREGKTFLIMFEEGDDQFMRLVFPNFWTIDTELERQQVNNACTAATGSTKVAKVFPVGTNIWASIELFCVNVGQFQAVLERGMGALGVAVERFMREMRSQLPQA